MPLPPPTQGHVAPGFEAVAQAFADNFSQRQELGAACSIYWRGELVVNLWGGCKEKGTERSWTQDTLTLVFSLTKGITGLTTALAVSQGLFDYDDKVTSVWPEFGASAASSANRDVTIGQLMSEQAGLAAIDLKLTPQNMADQDLLASTLAAQAPNWPPLQWAGNHSYSLGWLACELIRRRDPKKRSLGQFFADEMAQPLAAEFYIGLPASVSREKLARIQGFGLLTPLLHMDTLPWKMVLSMLWPWSLPSRALNNPLLWHGPAELDSELYRPIENGAIGGIGSAQAIATLYNEFATGGQRLKLARRVLDRLAIGHAPPSSGTYDQVLKTNVAYSYGLEKPEADWEFAPSRSSFGSFAVGGSLAFADPEDQIAYAYVTNKLGLYKWDDPRELAVRQAFMACLASRLNKG
jgi:CubicO group peptidase (beta-lactamase class C family)